jgi:ribosomal protein L15
MSFKEPDGEDVPPIMKHLQVERLEVEQLQVGRHFRLGAGAGRLTIHSSDSTTGVWLSGRDGNQPEGTICMVAERGRMPFFAVYPKSGYSRITKANRCPLPFAISAEGLQVPHPDGTVTILPLEKLAALVKQLAE